MIKTKKILFFFLFLFFGSYFCHAQTPDNNGDENKVEVVKMAYLSNELNLTPQEAQNFWPVYNNYVNEIKQARVQYPDDEVAFEKKVVEIKERYQGNFKKVLGNSDKRANKVYTADKQFNNTLRNELKRRQNFQQTPNQMQENRENNPVKNNNMRGAKKQHPPV